MELLKPRVERLGFFRPIIPSEPDSQLELIQRRYQARASLLRSRRRRRARSGLRRAAQARRGGVQGTRAALRLHPLRGHRLRRCHLRPRLRPQRRPRERARGAGARRRQGRLPDETVAAVQAARNSLKHKGCTIFGVLVNRVPEERRRDHCKVSPQNGDEPVYVMPERAELAYATIGEVAEDARRDHPRGPGESVEPRGARHPRCRDERRALHRRSGRRLARDRPGRPGRHPRREPRIDRLTRDPDGGGRRRQRRLSAQRYAAPRCSRARRSRCSRRSSPCT